MSGLSRQELMSALCHIFDHGKVRDDQATLHSHGCDTTKAYQVAPMAVVFPTSTVQVQALVLLANKHQVALVPSGGRTGLSGGAVASHGEVVVSFDYMNSIGVVNTVDQTVTVQPGAITQLVQQAAESAGLYYPVDFASSGSSQIGGNIATNAGGIKVIRYGMTRDWVVGLKVVTGTGEILDLNKGLIKNNTGYDFRHLFIGSEGTLGFIVEATLKLTQPPENLTAVVLGVASMDGIMNVLQTFQKSISLTAFEFFSESGLALVTQHGLNRPFDAQTPFYVLLEYEQTDEADALVMAAFEQCMDHAWVIDGVISQNESQHMNLWALRENLSETCAAFTPYKNDIAVKVSDVPGFLADIDAVIAVGYPDFSIVWWGHIGDGNLHLNILKPDHLTKAEFFDACKRVNKAVFDIVEGYGGSVSAEHGVGLLKKEYLHHTRSAADIAMMQGVKAVFDPKGIMNPGKMLP